MHIKLPFIVAGTPGENSPIWVKRGRFYYGFKRVGNPKGLKDPEVEHHNVRTPVLWVEQDL